MVSKVAVSFRVQRREAAGFAKVVSQYLGGGGSTATRSASHGTSPDNDLPGRSLHRTLHGVADTPPPIMPSRQCKTPEPEPLPWESKSTRTAGDSTTSRNANLRYSVQKPAIPNATASTKATSPLTPLTEQHAPMPPAHTSKDVFEDTTLVSDLSYLSNLRAKPVSFVGLTSTPLVIQGKRAHTAFPQPTRAKRSAEPIDTAPYKPATRSDRHAKKTRFTYNGEQSIEPVKPTPHALTKLLQTVASVRTPKPADTGDGGPHPDQDGGAGARDAASPPARLLPRDSRSRAVVQRRVGGSEPLIPGTSTSTPPSRNKPPASSL